MPKQQIRRVIVNDNADGKSATLVDDVLSYQDLGGGTTAVPLWRSDAVPSVPNNGAVSDVFGLPSSGGSWVFIWSIPPGSEPSEDGGGFIEMNDERPGFHATDTVDIDYIIAGNPTLFLDNGEVALNPGDSVILNGSNHAWQNLGSVPAIILTVMNGANREK